MNKATGAAVDRIAGSAAYRDAVRAAFLVTEDPDDDSRRLLTPIKENLPGFDRTALPFALDPLPDEAAAAILAGDQFAHLELTDREAIREQLRRTRFADPVKADPDAATRAKSGPNKVERCMAFIRTFLRTYAYPSDDLLEAAKAQKFTFDNVKEAKSRLKADGLRSTNQGVFQGEWWVGFGDPGTWNVRPTAETRTNTPPDSPHSQHSPHSQL
jgi:hypothetical protein